MKLSDFDLNVINVVTKLRVSKGLGQKNIAYLLHINQSTYSRIESGKKALTIGQLKLISTLFDLSLIEIIKLAENVTLFKELCDLK